MIMKKLSMRPTRAIVVMFIGPRLSEYLGQAADVLIIAHFFVKA